MRLCPGRTAKAPSSRGLRHVGASHPAAQVVRIADPVLAESWASEVRRPSCVPGRLGAGGAQADPTVSCGHGRTRRSLGGLPTSQPSADVPALPLRDVGTLPLRAGPQASRHAKHLRRAASVYPRSALGTLLTRGQGRPASRSRSTLTAKAALVQLSRGSRAAPGPAGSCVVWSAPAPRSGGCAHA